MDDDKTFTVQIKGTAYVFKAIPPEDMELIGVMSSLSVSNAKYVKLLTRVLADSAGSEQWDAITDRLISKEISIQEMTVQPFKALTEQQVADKPSAAKKTARKPRAARAR